MNAYTEIIERAAEMLRPLTGGNCRIGLILGSGLGGYADRLDDPRSLSYSEIEGFPVSSVPGHAGRFVVGEHAGKTVVVMQGRFHYYEGYGMDLVTMPVRVMQRLGISFLFVSNAAGGVNPAFKVGDLMIIRDHINLMPNPLIGKNIEEFGPRFPDMTRPYEPELIRLAEETANSLGIKLKKGVYLAGTGPTYETPAEYAFFGKAGADAVGMSTVPEVIVARHSSIPVFGMSVITNEAHSFADDFVNDGEDVVKAANEASGKMTQLFKLMIAKL